MSKRFRFSAGCLVLLIAFLSINATDVKAKQAEDGKTATASKEGPETWYATAYVNGAMGLHVIRYWSKGSWMRAETLLGAHPIITIVRGQDYIAFDVLEGRGARIRRSSAAVKEDESRSRPFGNELAELIAQNGVKVEETTEGDRAIEIWRKTDAAGRRKLWVTAEEPRLPIRLETFIRSGASTITTDYSGWTRGLEIPDSFFEAPANVTLESLDYSSFLEAATVRAIGPVLYPELLHGTPGN